MVVCWWKTEILRGRASAQGVYIDTSDTPSIPTELQEAVVSLASGGNLAD